MMSLPVIADYTDPAALGRRLADYVVLAVSPEVPQVAADYWEASEASYLSLQDLVATAVTGDDAAGRAYLALLGEPGSAGRIRALRAELARLAAGDPEWAAAAAGQVSAADERIWIDHWLGDLAADAPGLDVTTLPVSARTTGRPRPERDSGRTRIDVIIPFRDSARAQRLRNLIACLRALGDQDPVDALVRVTVIEADTTNWCSADIAPLADRYLHVYKAGRFNKSWVVNVGLRSTQRYSSPHPRQLVCVLDADILVERSFLSTNLARFDTPGHRAHLPYRWSLTLDDAATRYAIRRRVADQAPTVEPDSLRGLLLREPPGACMWAEAGLLHSIGGFDERFEGWGGEDDDVTRRIAKHTPLVRFDDQLLYLDHPRPEMTREDGTPDNERLLGGHLGADAWTGADGYGDPERFSRAVAAVREAAL
jgi:hypothetical protein